MQTKERFYANKKRFYANAAALRKKKYFKKFNVRY